MANKTNAETGKSTLETAAYTVQGFADWLGVSYATANALTWREGFPVVQLGRKKLIPKAAVEAWLMEQKRTY